MITLQADSIIKSFGTHQVLTDVFIECHQGDIIGLLGRNGSGKSTLLKIIFGVLPADRKFVRIGQKIINQVSDTYNLMSYLPQDHFMPSHLKVKHIIDLFCDAEPAKLLKQHHLVEPMLDLKSHKLSGGEKRLFEVLLIIHSKALFTLIDEPFNGIAPIYKDEIKRLIREQSEHKGFVITDHDYRNILDIATKTILLYDGGTKPIKQPSDLMRWGYLSELSNF